MRRMSRFIALIFVLILIAFVAPILFLRFVPGHERALDPAREPAREVDAQDLAAMRSEHERMTGVIEGLEAEVALLEASLEEERARRQPATDPPTDTPNGTSDVRKEAPVDLGPPDPSAPSLSAAAVKFTRAADAGLELDLRGAELTDEQLLELANLAHLRILGLRGSDITDEGLFHLHGLTELAHLDLRATKITGAGLFHLPPNLEALHLTDTPVTGDELFSLPSLPRLKTLKLNRLDFGDAHVGALTRYPGLDHLELDGTSITDQGLLQMLALLPNLTRIELRRTAVTAEMLAGVREMYPGVELVQQ